LKVSSSTENKYITSKQNKSKKTAEKKPLAEDKSIPQSPGTDKQTSHSTNEDKIDLSDKASKTLKADREEKEEKGILNSAYNWITGNTGEKDELLNQEKLKEFKEKLQKDDPERYKTYIKNQENSQKKITGTKAQSLQYALGIKNDHTEPDSYRVKAFEEKLKKEEPEKYKKYKEAQESSDKKINQSMSQAEESIKEGVKKSDYYFNVEKSLKYGLTGVDQYELDKQNKEGETTEEKIKDKDYNKYKNLMKNKFASDEEINKANLECADATQNIVDTVDITLGGAGKLVDAGNDFKHGNYKKAALDTGEAGVRIFVSAALESGKALEWAGSAGTKVLKTAGPGAKKLFSKGDELLKAVAPEVYEVVKTSTVSGKKAVTEALSYGGEAANKALKFATGSDAGEILEWAGKPVEEALLDAGKGIKSKAEGLVDGMIKSGKTGLKDTAGKTEILEYGEEILASKRPEEFGSKLVNWLENINKKMSDNPTITSINKKAEDLFYGPKIGNEEVLNEICNNAKKNFNPKKMSGLSKDFEFCGSEESTELIDKAMKQMPEGMKNNIKNLNEVYMDKITSKKVRVDAYGLSDPSNGKIALNETNLKTKNLEGQIDEINHEFFHQADYDLGSDGKFLSEMPDAPFNDPGAHNITDYARDCKSAKETAAETFKKLMIEKREFEKDFGSFDGEKFLIKLTDLEHWTQYKFIIDNYLTDSVGKLLW